MVASVNSPYADLPALQKRSTLKWFYRYALHTDSSLLVGLLMHLGCCPVAGRFYKFL
jgi:hypothetical protein